MLFKKLTNKVLYFLILTLVGFLIVDIQDGSFDTPVMIIHYLNRLISELNNLKNWSAFIDVLCSSSIPNLLNLYLLKCNLSLALEQILLILVYGLAGYLFTKYLPTTKYLPRTNFKFSEIQIANSKALISVP